MKKNSIFLAMLAVVLVFGLALSGCSSDTADPPVLTEFSTTDDAGGRNSTPTSSFSTGGKFGVRFALTSKTHAITKCVVTVKSGGTVTKTIEEPVDGWPEGQTRNGDIGGPKFIIDFSPGSYTFELHFEDAKGNKSNTMSAAVTVTQ